MQKDTHSLLFGRGSSIDVVGLGSDGVGNNANSSEKENGNFGDLHDENLSCQMFDTVVCSELRLMRLILWQLEHSEAVLYRRDRQLAVTFEI